jgi:hypothetical protein
MPNRLFTVLENWSYDHNKRTPLYVAQTSDVAQDVKVKHQSFVFFCFSNNFASDDRLTTCFKCLTRLETIFIFFFASGLSTNRSYGELCLIGLTLYFRMVWFWNVSQTWQNHQYVEVSRDKRKKIISNS